MPGFIREMIARGFWWAILAAFIFSLPFGIISVLIGKKSKFLQSVIQNVPSTLFIFYIWHIREHVGWLIFAILCSIGIFIGLVAQLISKPAKKSDEGSDTPDGAKLE
jgi:Na+/H+-dicarboxylate symporter